MFGKIPFSKEALKIDANGVHKTSAASFTSRTGILSWPADFADFSLWISRLIESGVTFWKANRGASADDPLLSKYFSGSSDSSHSIFSASFGPIVTKWLLKASAISPDLSIL